MSVLWIVLAAIAGAICGFLLWRIAFEYGKRVTREQQYAEFQLDRAHEHEKGRLEGWMQASHELVAAIGPAEARHLADQLDALSQANRILKGQP